MIHYLTPFDTAKQIGAAHNKAVELIKNSEDWICLRDADTMFLTPDFGQTIETAIGTHGANFQLLGCLTNRLGVPHQLYNGLSASSDISEHINIAKNCKENNTVTSCNLVAGMFMLFQKKTWEAVDGFKPSIHFDKTFSNDVISKGGKLGVLQSVYLFHLYRWGVNIGPQWHYKHLI